MADTSGAGAVEEQLRQLVEWSSHKYAELPGGLTRDRLVAAGLAIVPELLTGYDPATAGVTIQTFARGRIRAEMDALVRSERTSLKEARKAAPGKNTRPTSAALSAGIARAREEAEGFTGGRGELLLDAMLRQITTRDAEAIAAVLRDAAKAGDSTAAGALVLLLKSG